MSDDGLFKRVPKLDGVLMWVPMGIIYLVAGLAVASRLVSDAQLAGRTRYRRSGRSSGLTGRAR
jgi:hypothetical protein